jgi:hypothetical protein
MRVHLLLESVQGKVYSRSTGNHARVRVSVKVYIEKFSKDAGEAWFNYTLVRSSKLHQITLTGKLILHAEDEEVKELEAYATREKPLDPLIRTIVARLQPLILHIEEEFDLPLPPTLAVDEHIAHDKEDRPILMYI